MIKLNYFMRNEIVVYINQDRSRGQFGLLFATKKNPLECIPK